jgi:TP901-1 family phage major tail protein
VKTITSTTVFELSATVSGAAILSAVAAATLSGLGFFTVGGLRSKSFGFNSGAIDITNHDSEEWTKILDKAGVRNFSVSGSGVYTNEEIFTEIRTNAFANNLVCLMFIEVKTYTIFEGCFKITSLEISGDYDAESNYSLSAESSGQPTIQKLTA